MQMIRWLRAGALVSVLILAATAAPAAPAHAAGPLALEATYTSVSNGWSKVERWYDANPGFITAQYPSDGRLNQTGQRLTFFGNVARPAAGRYLLSYVAWSMGTLSARMYVSGVRQTWGSPYGGDVRKLILMGGPNNGWDWTFRHGTWPSIAAYPECGGSTIGGVAALWQNCYDIVYNHPELTAYATTSGDFFPGIRQMLKRWDATYPLDLTDADAYTNYYGGTGYYSYSYSYSIDYAIGQGSLIDPTRSAGVPASVPTYLLCGGAATIPYPWHNEHTGPSDGTVFTASCTDTGGIGTLAGTRTLSGVNHLQLVWDSTAMSQVTTWLN
jgi:hypothetical protein